MGNEERLRKIVKDFYGKDVSKEESKILLKKLSSIYKLIYS
jgi:hypothetical protein